MSKSLGPWQALQKRILRSNETKPFRHLFRIAETRQIPILERNLLLTLPTETQKCSSIRAIRNNLLRFTPIRKPNLESRCKLLIKACLEGKTSFVADRINLPGLNAAVVLAWLKQRDSKWWAKPVSWLRTRYPNPAKSCTSTVND